MVDADEILKSGSEARRLVHTLKSLRKENEQLKSIVNDIWWMARRYSHGRKTHAVSTYNEAIDRAISIGMEFEPDSIDMTIYAKDGMFEEQWFKDREANTNSPDQSKDIHKLLLELHEKKETDAD